MNFTESTMPPEGKQFLGYHADSENWGIYSIRRTYASESNYTVTTPTGVLKSHTRDSLIKAIPCWEPIPEKPKIGKRVAVDQIFREYFTGKAVRVRTGGNMIEGDIKGIGFDGKTVTLEVIEKDKLTRTRVTIGLTESFEIL
jgi:hypothetical protein